MIVSESARYVKINVCCHENDLFGVGQLAHMVALPSWKGACPARRLSGWRWSRGWLSAHRDRLARMSDPEEHTPPFVGLSRACFRMGMAASGLFAARKRSFEGRALSPRKGGARLYIMNGMTREAAQEPGGHRRGVAGNAGCCC